MEGLIAFVLLWIVPAFIVARVASRRGFSYWTYFVHSFLPSPFVALITLRVASTYAPAVAQMSEPSPAPTPQSSEETVGSTIPQTEAGSGAEVLELIEQLSQMREKGVLTQEEYDRKKKQLLDRL